MEVKVYYKCKEGAAAVESHRIPEFVGRTMTETTREGAGIDVTKTDVDLVAAIVESLQVSPGGGAVLARRVVFDPSVARMAGQKPPSGEQRVLVVRPERMGGVERIAVDGEVVWPEEAVEATDLAGQAERLEAMARQLA